MVNVYKFHRSLWDHLAILNEAAKKYWKKASVAMDEIWYFTKIYGLLLQVLYYVGIVYFELNTAYTYKWLYLCGHIIWTIVDNSITRRGFFGKI